MILETWNVRSLYRTGSLKTSGKRQLGKPWHRWEVNIRMTVREIRCGLDSFGSE
jgi:hypothetical protein